MNGTPPHPGPAHPGPDEDGPGEAIAVVGIAGRFPGARTPEEFWDRLVAGQDCLDELDDEELLAAGVPAPVLAGRGYVRRSASLDGFDAFDADFFGLPPAVAAAMDPQQRLFLEACWHALEDAGHDPARRDGAVGVFGAPSFSGYFGYNLLSHHDPRTLLGSGTSPALIHALTLTDPNFFATRVAHALDLRGPALTVQTAGPGRTLASAARRDSAWSPDHRAVSAMRHRDETIDDGEALSRALGALWEAGTDIDWSGARHGQERRLSLPGYPFRRVRHWTEPARPASATALDERSATDGRTARDAGSGSGHGSEPRVTGATDVGGSTRTADVLADVWAEVLGVSQVLPDDNFFDLGGDSALAARAAVLARQHGLEFAPQVLFEHPTVLRLAARITPPTA
ncbi:beta-ketoacyl synthase N-terminal-like domain-containing protein [Streptomyces griseus]